LPTSSNGYALSITATIVAERLSMPGAAAFPNCASVDEPECRHGVQMAARVRDRDERPRPRLA
jgi:hypothetical protein